MVSLGMVLCAHLIETSTGEIYYHRKQDGKIYWLQPGEQKVGDQVFNAFLGKSNEKMFVRSYKLLGKTSGLPLWIAVGLAVVGFVLQFVGLRGSHPSITLAQLGVSFLMAIGRALLRS